MALIIFLLIISIPILELSVLIDVGGEIGALSTVMLCLLTAGIGLSLVRMQGMRVIQDMQAKTQAGEPVGANLIHGFFLLIAGIFLFIPGFITDFLGALLLLPFVRLMLGKAGMARMVVRSNIAGGPFEFGGRGPNGPQGAARPHDKDGVTIDGEYESADGENSTDSQSAKVIEMEVIPPKKDT